MDRLVKWLWEARPGWGSALDVWACSGTRGHSLAAATWLGSLVLEGM